MCSHISLLRVSYLVILANNTTIQFAILYIEVSAGSLPNQTQLHIMEVINLLIIFSSTKPNLETICGE